MAWHVVEKIPGNKKINGSWTFYTEKEARSKASDMKKKYPGMRYTVRKS
jgi:hypothetical protein